MENKKEYIRSQFKDCKKQFDELLDTLSDAEWESKYPEQPFSVGEIMMQVANRLAFIPHVIHDIRKGKGFSNPPSFFVKIFQFFFNGFYGRDLTRKEIKERYAIAHRKTLHVLEHIHDTQWHKSAVFFGTLTTTEEIFKNYFELFYTNIGEIKKIKEEIK